MNNSKTILALVFLIAGTLLTTTAITTIVPAAYADNKNKAEDESAAAIADCDKNDVERAGFDCFGIAANDIDLDLGNGPRMVTTLTGADVEDSATEETETEETGIMSNPLFNLGQNSTG
jgi:uncharacterized membrane protein